MFNISMFSENFRQYRKLRGVTQEETGQALGVTFQTVSKWERGECWPDVTLLPGIAAYFDVSIDALFGMNQLRDRKRLNEAYRRAQDFASSGQLMKALSVLEEVYPSFPNEYGLLSEMALVLAQIGGEANLSRAIELMGCVLAEPSNTKLSGTTRAALCYAYCKNNEHEKAAALAKQLPHMRESREIVQAYVQEGCGLDYDVLLRELHAGG